MCVCFPHPPRPPKQTPMYIVLLYWSLFKTQQLGINLKILSLISAAIPLALFPVMVLIGSILTVGDMRGCMSVCVCTWLGESDAMRGST